jgi:hypothetical protein
MSVPAKRSPASHKTRKDFKKFYMRFYVSTAVKTAGYEMAQSNIRAQSFQNKTLPSPPREGLKAGKANLKPEDGGSITLQNVLSTHQFTWGRTTKGRNVN